MNASKLNDILDWLSIAERAANDGSILGQTIAGMIRTCADEVREEAEGGETARLIAETEEMLIEEEKS